MSKRPVDDEPPAEPPPESTAGQRVRLINDALTGAGRPPAPPDAADVRMRRNVRFAARGGPTGAVPRLGLSGPGTDYTPLAKLVDEYAVGKYVDSFSSKWLGSTFTILIDPDAHAVHAWEDRGQRLRIGRIFDTLSAQSEFVFTPRLPGRMSKIPLVDDPDVFFNPDGIPTRPAAARERAIHADLVGMTGYPSKVKGVWSPTLRASRFVPAERLPAHREMFEALFEHALRHATAEELRAWEGGSDSSTHEVKSLESPPVPTSSSSTDEVKSLEPPPPSSDALTPLPRGPDFSRLFPPLPGRRDPIRGAAAQPTAVFDIQGGYGPFDSRFDPAAPDSLLQARDLQLWVAFFPGGPYIAQLQRPGPAPPLTFFATRSLPESPTRLEADVFTNQLWVRVARTGTRAEQWYLFYTSDGDFWGYASDLLTAAQVNPPDTPPGLGPAPTDGDDE
jgi:hypothetical protein